MTREDFVAGLLRRLKGRPVTILLTLDGRALAERIRREGDEGVAVKG